MYNPRKDFENGVNKILGEYLKTKGFKRFKTRNYVRLTSDNIFQIINFQKSAGFAFYININSIPLSSIQNFFFPEGGSRIQCLNPDFVYDDFFGRFEFGIEYLMVQNLKEILYFFESKGIYWFDLVGNSETFLQFEIETEKNEKVYPILKKQVHREMDFAFLLLQCEKYDEAENYLINLNKLIYGKDENYYLNVHRDIIVSLLFQLKNSDYISIKKLIIGNIQKSLQNLDLQKIVPFQIDKVYIPQYLEVEVKNIDINPIPGDRGVGHYHTILDGNIVMFQSLRKLLQDEFTLVEISDLRFALKCNEKASFHFVLSDLISVSEEMSEVSQRYTKKGIDLSHLNEQKTRIEFWCDYDYRDDVNLYDIRDKIIKIIHEHLSKYVYIPWRFQFVS